MLVGWCSNLQGLKTTEPSGSGIANVFSHRHVSGAGLRSSCLCWIDRGFFYELGVHKLGVHKRGEKRVGVLVGQTYIYHLKTLVLPAYSSSLTCKSHRLVQHYSQHSSTRARPEEQEIAHMEDALPPPGWALRADLVTLQWASCHALSPQRGYSLAGRKRGGSWPTRGKSKRKQQSPPGQINRQTGN